jgi:hypothetical protein
MTMHQVSDIIFSMHPYMNHNFGKKYNILTCSSNINVSGNDHEIFLLITQGYTANYCKGNSAVGSDQ